MEFSCKELILGVLLGKGMQLGSGRVKTVGEGSKELECSGKPLLKKMETEIVELELESSG